MKVLRIVLDTNILYAGLYSARGASFRILRLIEKGEIIPLLSTTLLFEYEDVLKRNQETLRLNHKIIEGLLDNLCSLGEYQKVYFLWRPILSDPKDDHILELAVASDADMIVTHNIKDFKKSNMVSIKTITPKQLLEGMK